jgi:hypothetical protein
MVSHIKISVHSMQAWQNGETWYEDVGVRIIYHAVCSSMIQAAWITRANTLKTKNQHTSFELGSTPYPKATHTL